jgi:hypothetical protein
MTKIFIVMGATGKYDYYQEWLVKAFLDHDKAADYVILCKGEADRIIEFMNSPIRQRVMFDLEGSYAIEQFKINPYDSNMSETYYDINYFVSEMELEE